MWTKKNDAQTVKDVVLQNFGVSDVQELNQWFIKSRSNQYRIDGLQKAAEILRKNKSNVIFIAGDYDADGIMASSILFLALKQAGFPKVDCMIPQRHTEGYGLNVGMIERMANAYHADEKICLITVDNGIVAFEPIAEAKKRGWDVIVTDHHLGLKDETGTPILPEADVVIDPAAIDGSADFSGYCGAGLAFRIAREILGVQEAKRLMPLATVATFADVMPLREENYVFCKDGLNYLNKGLAPAGLLELVKANKLELVEDMDVLFKLAPEVNAPGRLFPDGAMKCVSLMLASGYSATMKAEDLIRDNNTRKTMVTAATDMMMDKIADKQDDIYVEYIPKLNPGIVGIIAGHITEAKRRPCIVLTDSMKNNDMLTGSARTVEAVHIKDALDHVADTLAGYGGHAGAAGLTVEKDRLDEFKNALQTWVASQNFVFESAEDNVYDLEIQAEEIPAVMEEVKKYAPYGEQNPRPLFKINDFRVAGWSAVAGNGIRITSNVCTAIGFGLMEKLRPTETLAGKNLISLYGNLSYNHFRGISKPQVEFCDYE